MTRGLAEQARAADCLQRPLRSRFRQRLTRSVGLLGAAVLPGVARGKTDHVRRFSTTRRMATRRRPDGRHAPSRQACGHPCWPVVPYALAGPWWWPLPLQQRGLVRALARAGADAHVWGRRHVPVSRGTVAAWTGGSPSCAVGGSACRPRREGSLQGPAAVGGAASRAVSQPHQARHGRQHAPGRSSRARWGHARSTPVPGAVSAALSHDPAGVAASCGQGGARVGGGGRSPGGEGTRVGSQPPNKGVQLTASSLRSFLAPASSSS